MLTAVEIKNYRGIREGKVDGLGAVNVFVGPNGSGKSTLLEAIFLGAVCGPNWLTHVEVVGIRGGDSIAAGSPLPERPMIALEAYPLVALRHNEYSFPTIGCWFERDTRQKIEVTYTQGGGAEVTARVEENQPFTFSPGGGSNYYAGMRLLDIRALLSQGVERRAWSALLDQRRDRTLSKVLHEVYGLEVESFSYTPEGESLRVLLKNRDFAPEIDDLSAGMRIAFRLFASLLLARKSALLVEEFDGYQHVQSLPLFVRALLRLARESENQLFLATHSTETVRTFVAEAKGSSEPVDLRVIQTALSTDGAFRSSVLGLDDAETLLDAGLDVRKVG